MLREYFGEPKRQDGGLLLETVQALRAYRNRMTRKAEEHPEQCEEFTKLEVWTEAFEIGLDELEQSVFCAGKYRERVKQRFTEAMDEEELLHYRRHVYFFKNGFIRIFSLLDKLGYFLDDLYDLQTHKIKPKFSYFTVLRRFPELNRELELYRRLNDLKSKYQAPMVRLRKKRNMEIHLINFEMLDELERSHLCSFDRTYVENLSENMNDLRQGFEMVARSILSAFEWASRHR